MLIMLGTGASDSQLEQLAHSGKIEENAPVKASCEIIINAPPEKVWRLLTDVKNWPKWQPHITQAEIYGPIQSGTRFTWTSGTTIKSQIALVHPVEELVWTGTAYNAKAIHLWTLQRLPGEHTLLKTRESMSGFLLSLFFSSRQLQETDQDWLTSLKKEVER